jgi:hypothetical protein
MADERFDVEAGLTGLGAHVRSRHQVPDGLAADVGARVRAASRTRRRTPAALVQLRRSLLASAAAVTVAAALVWATALSGGPTPWPQPRGDEVAQVPTGSRVSLSAAEDAFGHNLRLVSSRGNSGVTALVPDTAPAPYVSLLYGELTERRFARASSQSHALVQIAGDARPFFAVMRSTYPDVRVVKLHSSKALWLPSPVPLIYRDGDGQRQELAGRTDSSALVWVRGGVTYRLEADASLAELRELAGRTVAS